MAKLIINNYDEFAAYLGKNLGTSDYVELSQERINMFADATLDHQWIHVDTERAAVESPYKTTIAHGYLTLSMLPYLWEQVIKVNNVKMLVNYGMDKMKFGQPVKSGESVRLVADLYAIENLRGIAKVQIKFAIEIKDSPQAPPAFHADDRHAHNENGAQRHPDKVLCRKHFLSSRPLFSFSTLPRIPSDNKPLPLKRQSNAAKKSCKAQNTPPPFFSSTFFFFKVISV